MNIIKFIESFTNEGIMQSLNNKASRRDSFSQFGKIGASAAMAAVPFGLLMPNKANAASASTAAFFAAADETATGALKLALTLEYLEDEFYKTALDTTGFLTGNARTIIAQIAKHESAHVAQLRTVLGGDAQNKPVFDFTGGRSTQHNGPFQPFTDLPTFFALAQAFEDTGVRAYKGQAANLMSDKALLTAALQIHSVEARHASEIRRYRGLKGWIVGKERGEGIPEQAQAVYDGEENVNQAGFMTNNVPGTFTPPLSATGGTESFDEPITGAVATTIASLFIVP
jgi:rubrerythrin